MELDRSQLSLSEGPGDNLDIRESLTSPRDTITSSPLQTISGLYILCKKRQQLLCDYFKMDVVSMNKTTCRLRSAFVFSFSLLDLCEVCDGLS